MKTSYQDIPTTRTNSVDFKDPFALQRYLEEKALEEKMKANYYSKDI
jgi:ribosomal protein S18